MDNVGGRGQVGSLLLAHADNQTVGLPVFKGENSRTLPEAPTERVVGVLELQS